VRKISFETLRLLSDESIGLTDIQVNSQRKTYGENKVVEAVSNLWAELVIETFKDPMIWFLLVIGIIFIFVGNITEAFTLLVAIIPLVFMDAILNWRTQNSVVGLKGQLASKVCVIRNNKEDLIESQELVPGDLVMIKTGSILPGDGFFKNSQDIQIDESALTGESFPIHKKNINFNALERAKFGVTLVDVSMLGFAGTRVLTGQGEFRVLLTSSKTAYGEIIQSVSQMPKERTPLQKSISNLVKWLIGVSVIFCLLLAAARIYQGHGWLDAFLSAATLAIAAIPEEFPVVFTFFLGVGVYRLAKKNALVRRAVSVENIGRITYICTDKTGTITSGKLKLAHLEPFESITIHDLLRAGLYASNPQGDDPVDLAIEEIANQKNIIRKTLGKRFPFTEDRKRESAILTQNNLSTSYIKGAPEIILNLSSLSEINKVLWKNKVISWAKDGHKVLAVATKEMTSQESDHNSEPQNNFDFCGLMAFEDPARPEVAPSLNYCQKNGIRVMMITGDHPITALAIAKEVGLGGQNPNIISAEQYSEKFEENYLFENPLFLKNQDVVARCSPLQKLRIVNALKNSGELVAVTGDGVNDVPALKAADIGIAMGERGTRSAKEVSSIILADDNFNTIVNAIMEGRQLFLNLKLSFEYLLLIHIPLVLTAALIPLFDYPILYLPIHIVWLELIIHPTALFAFQKNASKFDSIPQTHNRFFTKKRIILIAIVGLAFSTCVGFIFQKDYNYSLEIDFARSKSITLLIFWSAALVLHFTHLKTKASAFIFIRVFAKIKNA
jgi:Ca2+-transporting ATPase